MTIDASASAAHDDATSERVGAPLISVVIEGPEREVFYIDDLTAETHARAAHFLHGALLVAANRLDRITQEKR